MAKASKNTKDSVPVPVAPKLSSVVTRSKRQLFPGEEDKSPPKRQRKRVSQEKVFEIVLVKDDKDDEKMKKDSDGNTGTGASKQAHRPVTRKSSGKSSKDKKKPSNVTASVEKSKGPPAAGNEPIVTDIKSEDQESAKHQPRILTRRAKNEVDKSSPNLLPVALFRNVQSKSKTITDDSQKTPTSVVSLLTAGSCERTSSSETIGIKSVVPATESRSTASRQDVFPLLTNILGATGAASAGVSQQSVENALRSQSMTLNGQPLKTTGPQPLVIKLAGTAMDPSLPVLMQLPNSSSYTLVPPQSGGQSALTTAKVVPSLSGSQSGATIAPLVPHLSGQLGATTMTFTNPGAGAPTPTLIPSQSGTLLGPVLGTIVPQSNQLGATTVTFARPQTGGTTATFVPPPPMSQAGVTTGTLIHPQSKPTTATSMPPQSRNHHGATTVTFTRAQSGASSATLISSQSKSQLGATTVTFTRAQSRATSSTLVSAQSINQLAATNVTIASPQLGPTTGTFVPALSQSQSGATSVTLVRSPLAGQPGMTSPAVVSPQLASQSGATIASQPLILSNGSQVSDQILRSLMLQGSSLIPNAGQALALGNMKPGSGPLGTSILVPTTQKSKLVAQPSSGPPDMSQQLKAPSKPRPILPVGGITKVSPDKDSDEADDLSDSETDTLLAKMEPIEVTSDSSNTDDNNCIVCATIPSGIDKRMFRIDCGEALKNNLTDNIQRFYGIAADKGKICTVCLKNVERRARNESLAKRDHSGNDVTKAAESLCVCCGVKSRSNDQRMFRLDSVSSEKNNIRENIRRYSGVVARTGKICRNCLCKIETMARKENAFRAMCDKAVKVHRHPKRSLPGDRSVLVVNLKETCLVCFSEAGPLKLVRNYVTFDDTIRNCVYRYLGIDVTDNNLFICGSCERWLTKLDDEVKHMWKIGQSLPLPQRKDVPDLCPPSKRRNDGSTQSWNPGMQRAAAASGTQPFQGLGLPSFPNVGQSPVLPLPTMTQHVYPRNTLGPSATALGIGRDETATFLGLIFSNFSRLHGLVTGKSRKILHSPAAGKWGMRPDELEILDTFYQASSSWLNQSGSPEEYQDGAHHILKWLEVSDEYVINVGTTYKGVADVVRRAESYIQYEATQAKKKMNELDASSAEHIVVEDIEDNNIEISDEEGDGQAEDDEDDVEVIESSEGRFIRQPKPPNPLTAAFCLRDHIYIEPSNVADEHCYIANRCMHTDERGNPLPHPDVVQLAKAAAPAVKTPPQSFSSLRRLLPKPLPDGTIPSLPLDPEPNSSTLVLSSARKNGKPQSDHHYTSSDPGNGEAETDPSSAKYRFTVIMSNTQKCGLCPYVTRDTSEDIDVSIPFDINAAPEVIIDAKTVHREEHIRYQVDRALKGNAEIVDGISEESCIIDLGETDKDVSSEVHVVEDDDEDDGFHQREYLAPCGVKRANKTKRMCWFCRETFTKHDWSSFMKHMAVEHPRVQRMKCMTCGENFFHKKSFIMHVRMVGCARWCRVRPHKCSICPCRYKLEYNLRQHMTLHTGRKAYSCDVCQEEFTSDEKLVRHRSKVHKIRRPKYPCQLRAEAKKKKEKAEKAKKELEASKSEDSSSKITKVEKPPKTPKTPKTSKTKEENFIYVCDICGRCYMDQNMAKDHTIKEHGDEQQEEGKTVICAVKRPCPTVNKEMSQVHQRFAKNDTMQAEQKPLIAATAITPGQPVLTTLLEESDIVTDDGAQQPKWNILTQYISDCVDGEEVLTVDQLPVDESSPDLLRLLNETPLHPGNSQQHVYTFTIPAPDNQQEVTLDTSESVIFEELQSENVGETTTYILSEDGTPLRIEESDLSSGVSLVREVNEEADPLEISTGYNLPVVSGEIVDEDSVILLEESSQSTAVSSLIENQDASTSAANTVTSDSVDVSESYQQENASEDHDSSSPMKSTVYQLLENPDDIFTCPVCSEMLSGLSNFSEHVLSIHNNSFPHKLWTGKLRMYSYKCLLCTERQYSFKNISQHIQAVHGIPRISLNGETEDMINYVTNHDGLCRVITNKFECRLCDHMAAVARNARKHRRRCHARTVSCLLCEAIFTDGYDAFKEHFNIAHKSGQGENDNSVKVCACFICEKKLSLKDDMKKHMNSHYKQAAGKGTGVGESCCHLCGLVFPSGAHLRSHRRARHPKCRVCEQYFDSMQATREHIRDRHPEETYTCFDCGKVFYISRDRMRHMVRNHREGIEEFKSYCQVCNRGFVFNADLKRHMLLHKPKSYLCPVCGKTFRWNYSVRIHCRSQHPGTTLVLRKNAQPDGDIPTEYQVLPLTNNPPR